MQKHVTLFLLLYVGAMCLKLKLKRYVFSRVSELFQPVENSAPGTPYVLMIDKIRASGLCECFSLDCQYTAALSRSRPGQSADRLAHGRLRQPSLEGERSAGYSPRRGKHSLAYGLVSEGAVKQNAVLEPFFALPIAAQRVRDRGFYPLTSGHLCYQKPCLRGLIL